MVHVVPTDQLPTGIHEILAEREQLAAARRKALQATLDQYEILDRDLRLRAVALGFRLSRELGHADLRVAIRL